jgi:hypothetical protein
MRVRLAHLPPKRLWPDAPAITVVRTTLEPVGPRRFGSTWHGSLIKRLQSNCPQAGGPTSGSSRRRAVAVEMG